MNNMSSFEDDIRNLKWLVEEFETNIKCAKRWGIVKIETESHEDDTSDEVRTCKTLSELEQRCQETREKLDALQILNIRVSRQEILDCGTWINGPFTFHNGARRNIYVTPYDLQKMEHFDMYKSFTLKVKVNEFKDEPCLIKSIDAYDVCLRVREAIGTNDKLRANKLCEPFFMIFCMYIKIFM